MTYAQGVEFDIYISFARADDLETSVEPLGWVFVLVSHLFQSVATRLGSNPTMFYNRPVATEERLRAVRQSAVMVAVTSSSYFDQRDGQKPITLLELEEFVRANDLDRLFVAEREPSILGQLQYPYLMGKEAVQFHERATFGQTTQVVPMTLRTGAPYLYQVGDLGNGIAKQLQLMRRAGPPQTKSRQPDLMKRISGQLADPYQTKSSGRTTMNEILGQLQTNIFISYRRKDQAGWAGRLYDSLIKTFPFSQIFMDVDSIPAGADFIDYIGKQVERCDILLAIIGANWRGERFANGEYPIAQDDDFVRIEIAAALKADKRVIPVLVDDTRMPPAEDLPRSLKPLARRNAVRITHEHFHGDFESLIRELKAKRNVS
jgi:TIR domain